MELKVKLIGIQTFNTTLVILETSDAFKLGAKPGDRVRIYKRGEDKEVSRGYTGVVDIATSEQILQSGTIGLYEHTFKNLGFKKEKEQDYIVDIEMSSKPQSFNYIAKKIRGELLTKSEINAIIHSITDGHHTPIELAAFITAIETRELVNKEIISLCEAMTYSGEVLEFGDNVFDKHSTGGVPGNKVTLLIVPIVAASGLFIPKTSTRAITSPSGTADSMECLAPIAFEPDHLKELLKKKVVIAWGGAIRMAPADNILINIEKPLGMDPPGLMIASILSKKMCMGVKKLVLDIPCGPGTKFKDLREGRKFATLFNEIAAAVGIECICALTNAIQPVGHGIGPALEAREALAALQDPKNAPSSLVNKSVELSGILLEMGGKAQKGQGQDLAREILTSGEAYAKMKEIIQLQGGNPEIQVEDIPIGPYSQEMYALSDGFVSDIDNQSINRIAKLAGCPGCKPCGILLKAKIGSKITKGQVVLVIYSNSKEKLKEAVEYYRAHPPLVLGGMIIETV